MGGFMGAAKQPDALAYGVRTLYDKTKDKKTTPTPDTITETPTEGATSTQKRKHKSSALQIPTV